MNVAVILNHAFDFICYKCWTVDVLLDMDLFLHLRSDLGNFFFLFLNHLNEQTPCNHRRKLALSEYKAIKQNRLSELEHAAWQIAGHIWWYSSLTAWSRFAAWSDTVWRLLFTVEKLTKVFLLKRWEIFALRGFICSRFCSTCCCQWPNSGYKERTTSFWLFPVPVCPQCTSSV